MDRARAAGPGDPLVGREGETGRLRQILTDGTHPGPWLVEVSGDPGIGKTRLLAEWTALAGHAGRAVLSGRAPTAPGAQPFALFRAPVVRALDLPGTARALPPEERALLLRHFTDGETTEGDQDALSRSIITLLWAAASATRLTLCLDDVHRADTDSLALLAHLLRRPRPRTPLILVCAYRPRSAPAALTASLADADAGYRVDRLRLGPLPRGGVDDLVGRALAPAHRRLLHDAAEGNPFHLRVLSQAPAPFAPPGGVTPWVLPDDALMTAASALAAELGALDDGEHEVLRAAAVLGETFDPVHLPALTGHDPAVTARALDRLIALDLVRADHADGRTCRLRHPVLRTVVYHHAPHGRRRTAHLRADLVLRASGAPAAQRAPHVSRYAEPGDQDAVRLLAEAADEVRASAPEAAVSWLRTALSLNREEDGDGLRVRLTASLARALGALGRLTECRELLRRVPEPAEGVVTRADVELVVFRAVVERHLGNYAGAQALLTSGLGRIPQGTADRLESSGPLRLELATVSLLRTEFSRARELAEGVLREARAGRHRALRTAAAVRLTHCGAFAGDVTPLLGRGREAGALVDSTRDTDLLAQLDTVAQLGWAETLAERHHDALRHTARGIRLAQGSGQLFVLPYLRLAHAYASVSVGRLTDAARSAEEAEEDARRMERPALLGFALALRAWAASPVDGPDAAAAVAERAVQEVGAGGRLWGVTAGVLAGVRLGQGRAVECLALTRSAMEHDRHPGTARCVRPMWWALGARAAAALGDRAEAAEWARKAARDAESLDLPGQRGHAALARAHSVPDPVGPLEEAVAGFRTAGLVLMECRARLLLADALTLPGRGGPAGRQGRGRTREPAREQVWGPAREQASGLAWEQALEHVNRAKSLADAFGAHHLYREAVDVQRRLGARRPRTAARTPLPDMSERELEITRMVALGLSNNDIARTLVVSPKTIEAHLTRIFRKAGVRSRAALAATLPQPLL
ncbi:AAA family ATPase [Streptomyces sp. NPDC004539]|uniref:helix-turn-helix transcriptional regulator n=1 Tax=Streptomyces sp. NPDC004539 TaxID=3154280 RepID=UPI00339F6307